MTLELVTDDYVNGNLDRAYPMTVGTLIQKLQTCNPNKPVRLVVDGFNLMDMPSFGVSESEEDVSLGRFDDMALFVIEDEFL